MNPQIKKIVYHGNRILNKPITIIVFLLILFIYFAVANASFENSNREILKNLQTTTANTKDIVSKQDETLAAIKQLATDNKVTSEQKTNIIICMLQVPIEQRTTDILNQCRKQAEASPSPTPVKTNTTNPQSNQPNALTPTSQSSQKQPGVPERVQNFIKGIVNKIVGFFK